MNPKFVIYALQGLHGLLYVVQNFLFSVKFDIASTFFKEIGKCSKILGATEDTGLFPKNRCSRFYFLTAERFLRQPGFIVNWKILCIV